MTYSGGIPNPIPLSWIHLADEHESFDRNRFYKQIFTKNNKTKSKPNEKFAVGFRYSTSQNRTRALPGGDGRAFHY